MGWVELGWANVDSGWVGWVRLGCSLARLPTGWSTREARNNKSRFLLESRLMAGLGAWFRLLAGLADQVGQLRCCAKTNYYFLFKNRLIAGLLSGLPTWCRLFRLANALAT